MSRINFNGCKTVGDIERLHAAELPANLLVQYNHRSPSETIDDDKPPSNEKQMLIFSVSRSGDNILFETEEKIGERLLLSFKMGELAITSVLERGDVFWSPDNYQQTSYAIKDLNEDGSAFDGLLREALDLTSSTASPLGP